MRPDRRSPVAAGVLLLVCLASGAVRGAAPATIRVERVLVPKTDVGSAFPPGTELRGMPAKEFDDLLEAARAGLETSEDQRTPSLIRASHAIIWRDGMLFGQSRLLIEGPKHEPAMLDLSPWGLALRNEDENDSTGQLRATADGRIALRVDPGPSQEVRLNWELAARPGSDGRAFALGLPACPVTELSLELPGDMLPDGPPGAEKARKRWTTPKRLIRTDGAGGFMARLQRNQSTCDCIRLVMERPHASGLEGPLESTSTPPRGAGRPTGPWMPENPACAD